MSFLSKSFIQAVNFIKYLYIPSKPGPFLTIVGMAKAKEIGPG